ncbi:MAG: GtrA family protein [Candidatus Saccharibacteria bacterium]
MAVGVLGFLCNYLVLKICVTIGLNSLVSEIIAAAMALQVTFIAHDKWTYRREEAYKSR